MKFEIDKQTLSDLNIEQTPNSSHSILGIFNAVHTFGGWLKLKAIFANPTTDIDVLKNRQSLLKFLQNFDHPILVSKNDAEFIEHYLNQNAIKVSSSKIRAIENGLMAHFSHAHDYYTVKKGIKTIIETLIKFQTFTSKFDVNMCPKDLRDYLLASTNIFGNNGFKKALEIPNCDKLTAIEIGYFDHLFRQLAKNELKEILEILYNLDCYMAVAVRSKQLNFCFPEILNQADKTVKLEGLYHPLLSNPVPNNVEFNSIKNVTLLTGPNMAGKSTFLKSLGIAIFLTHLGFPVPANSMQTTLFNGLTTTINLFDNLQQGYSHFYNEVMRVKQVAIKINSVNNIFVIFDELFRGTNVKDAYDGSLAITNAFTEVTGSIFVISTHIVEIAESLESNKRVDFVSLDVQFEKGVPNYNYKLRTGVSKERLGIYIIEKEK